MEQLSKVVGHQQRKSPLLSVQQFLVQEATPYPGDTMLVNIYGRLSGEVVENVVSATVFNRALIPDDETLRRAYGNLKL